MLGLSVPANLPYLRASESVIGSIIFSSWKYFVFCFFFFVFVLFLTLIIFVFRLELSYFVLGHFGILIA